MKTRIFPFIVGAAVMLSSCVTRIITTAEAPASTPTVVYTQPTTRVVYGSTYVQPTQTTTIVKSTPSKTTTTVVNVTPLGEDVSFFLDLRAVGAAFAASNTLEEFERLLNSSSYMLNSLDLNHDGYVDYLRVIEVVDGYNHVIVIQAVLAQNIFQDVATLTVEMSYSTPYVQIIGAPYVYGANYYVRPVFVRTPPIFARWRGAGYSPWHSPYYWDYYPHHYTKPAPVYLSHYQAYVNTYITNNHYCNHCEFDDRAHYTDYSRTSSQVTRKDYETRHPEQSFSRRVTESAASSSVSRTATISNARDLQQRVASNTKTITGSTSTSTSRTISNTSGSSTTTSRTNTNTGSSSTTTSRTNTNTGGSSTTTSRTNTNTGSSSTTTSTSRKVTPATTTTTSRVNTSGTSRTTTKTVNTDGSSTTTRRGAASSTSSSSRSSSSSSSSRTSNSSNSSRSSSSSSSSRSSGTSTSSRTSTNNTQRR